MFETIWPIVFWTTIGVAIVIVVVRDTVQKRQLRDSGVTTMGRIVKTYRESDGEGGSRYVARVEFTDLGGRRHSERALLSTSVGRRYKIGTQREKEANTLVGAAVEVVYLQDNPKRFSIKSDLF